MDDFDDKHHSDDGSDNEDENMDDADAADVDAPAEDNGDGDADMDDGDGNDDDDDDEDDADGDAEGESDTQNRDTSAKGHLSRQGSEQGQDKAPTNPIVLRTSPSPGLGASRGSPIVESWIPSPRPEALTARTYDIVPTIAAPQSTSINAIAVTPDMRYVFSGGSDGYIRMYDWVDTVNFKMPLTVAQKHPFVDSVMKAGSLLTYWENEEAPSGVRTPPPPNAAMEPKDSSPAYSLAVQRQALWLLSGLESGAINVQTCRHQAGTRIHTMREHTSAVSVMSLAPDETSLLTGSWDKRCIDWDLNVGKVKRTFEGGSGQISAIERRPTSSTPIPRVLEDQKESLTFSTNNGVAPSANGSLFNEDDMAASLEGSLFGDDMDLFGETDAGHVEAPSFDLAGDDPIINPTAASLNVDADPSTLEQPSHDASIPDMTFTDAVETMDDSKHPPPQNMEDEQSKIKDAGPRPPEADDITQEDSKLEEPGPRAGQLDVSTPNDTTEMPSNPEIAQPIDSIETLQPVPGPAPETDPETDPETETQHLDSSLPPPLPTAEVPNSTAESGAAPLDPTSAPAPAPLTNGFGSSHTSLDEPSKPDITDPQETNAEAEPPPSSETTFLDAAIDGSIRIWDLRAQAPVARILPQQGTPPWCMGVTWSPDGDTFWAGRRNGTVDEYCVRAGGGGGSGGGQSMSMGVPTRSFRFPTGSGAVSAVRCMPNGRHLVW